MFDQIYWVPMVRLQPEDEAILLDDLYEDREEAKAACVERLRVTRFGSPQIEAKWWDSNVGSNYTSDDGINYATLYQRTLKRRGA